eukprot:7390422-Prymnesium_polylepis.3
MDADAAAGVAFAAEVGGEDAESFEADSDAELAIEVAIERLEIDVKKASELSFRRLQLEVDVLGLPSTVSTVAPDKAGPASPQRAQLETIAPSNRSETVAVRSLATRGAALLFFRMRTPLLHGSKARRVVRDALRSETLEDSDVYIVLHGLGKPGSTSREVATGDSALPWAPVSP